jgi:hypothetical protein
MEARTQRRERPMLFGARPRGCVPNGERLLFRARSRGRVPDGERFPCLTFLFMDPLGRDPLIRSFERHLYAENRSARTITTYLIAVRQADAFLRERGTSLEAATRADLEAFMADLLTRRMAAPPRPTARSSRSSTAGWPRKRRSRPTRWPRSSGLSCLSSRSQSCPRRPLVLQPHLSFASVVVCAPCTGLMAAAPS